MQTRGMGKGLLLGAVLFWVMLPWVGHTVPNTINYQGYLTDSVGTPINATVQMVFSLYSGPSVGTALWTETQSVVIASGVYSVTLGSLNPITLPFDSQYYLGVKVGTDPEMTPRQPLASVPYAFRAGSVTGTGTFSQPILSTVTTGTAPLQVSSTTAVSNLNADLLDGQHSSAFAPAVHNHDSAYINVTGDTMTGALNLPTNGLVVGTNQLVLSGGKVGIGTVSPSELLEVKSSSSSAFMVIDRGTDQLGGIVYRESGENQWYFPFFRGWQYADSNNLIVRDQKYDIDTMVFQSQTGNVGVGMTGGLLPGARLDVNGDVRIRYSLVFTDSSGNPYPENWIGMVNNIEGTKKWLHVGGVTDSGVGGDNLRRLALVADRNYFYGSVGINKVTPSERLDVQGNIKVSGAGNGVIFPDGRKQTSRFPAPDYDSGWRSIDPDQDIVLEHNLLGDANKYVVDLQFYNPGGIQIHNSGIGGDYGGSWVRGGSYRNLNGNFITVHRYADDTSVNQFRIRIWLYE